MAAWAQGRDHPTIVELAAKYKVQPTQIVYAWHIARGISILARSAKEDRLKEDRWEEDRWEEDRHLLAHRLAKVAMAALTLHRQNRLVDH